jgi:dihydrodiol dehydrogenase / D-xylose 1-dehydrogenase (NADP)
MAKKIRWGILAAGGIAHKFVTGLGRLEDAEAYAIGSRSLEKAVGFARQYGMEKAYGSYEELAGDPDVDVIYVATPHPYHMDAAMTCLRSGKAVLLEKPFTLNAKDARKVIDYARDKGLFLMEAMWTRFLPAVAKVREWLSDGLIGEVRFLKADFGFRGSWEPEGRLLNPALGGGALLDVGIYPVSFASMVFGTQPGEIHSMAHIGRTGVDEQYALIFGYDEGRLASLNGAVRTQLNNTAVIYGTEGMIEVPEFWQAKTAFLRIDGKPPIQFSPELDGNGYNYEAAEVTRLLRSGEKESAVMPLDETLEIMKTMDRIRSQWNLVYPAEL